MLGPIFMHWDGNFETYHRFISHLQIKLSDVQHHNIFFGTDEEAADNMYNQSILEIKIFLQAITVKTITPKSV